MANPTISNHSSDEIFHSIDRTERATILSGNNVVKGAVLAQNPTTKKFQAYNAATLAATDGTQYPVAIAHEAIDASAADKVGSVVVLGVAYEGKLVFAGGVTLDSVTTNAPTQTIRQLLRNSGLEFYKTNEVNQPDAQ